MARRKEAFSFGYFHEHCRTTMATAFPPPEAMPDTMMRAIERLGAVFTGHHAHRSPSERLALLKPLFDAESDSLLAKVRAVS